MTKTALVTGASSGIGREFARYHASKGGNVIITARRVEQLEALKSELEAAHGVTVTVIALDLGAPGGAAKLHEAVKATGIRVDYLINNAGFGGRGAFLERELSEDLDMIRLNVEALVSLCHMFGNDMVAAGGGKILNVSSTASYMPGPLQATYFATKAYVSNFSQALAEELRGKGVTVTALEPGYVPTEFAARADLEGTKLASQKGMTPADVAKIGYDAMEAGKLYVINEKSLAFTLKWVLPFLPRRMNLNMVRKMQEKGV
ncbi:SDR family oxidoreductase [Ruegeria sp. 2012CJ41-6]|uniref:SDR family oxidoreductase n=1 Tax=Ruegeria spongiae TaxID=2942209 RepID=A0ABT0Q0N6_9RHOB|nr:SDR family oxidoreductase [Ruegeria spongiae]MCL6282499.1 SDR family oxidoreductase [Ruegeria spongiae]